MTAAPSAMVFVELFFLLPFTDRVLRLTRDLKKSAAVIRSSRISDHWKQKALPRYSRNILLSSMVLALFIGILFPAFLVAYGLLGLLFIGDVRDVFLTFNTLEAQFIVLVSGVVYGIVRNKISKSHGKSAFNYGWAARMLHHIALDHRFFKEMTFDMDCMMTKRIAPKPVVTAPVYIAGLARAGTTILLEALYSTDLFKTLTYRDMPFVLAPYLWNKVTHKARLTEEMKQQRAHGDRIYVNYDSPEAFEEVFWMTFQKKAYVCGDRLLPHEVDRNLQENYRIYVANILSRDGSFAGVRYLAKNNNNLLRIHAVKSAFPDSIFIVPFRNPLHHAKSLQLQHERFLNIHAEDPFSVKYMNWLGHFEFGAGFRPFHFTPEALPKNEREPARLEYWLRYWESVYEVLMDQYGSDVVFFNHDKLCEQPERMFERLESELCLPDGSLKRFTPNIQPSIRHLTPEETDALPSRANEIYHKLQELSI